jgi:hypothetical protein
MEATEMEASYGLDEETSSLKIPTCNLYYKETGAVAFVV